MENQITEKQFLAWKEDPVTKVFFTMLRERRWDIMRFRLDLLSKAEEKIESNTLEMAHSNGHYAELSTILDTDYETLKESLEAYTRARSENRKQIKEMLGVDL